MQRVNIEHWTIASLVSSWHVYNFLLIGEGCKVFQKLQTVLGCIWNQNELVSNLHHQPPASLPKLQPQIPSQVCPTGSNKQLQIYSFFELHVGRNGQRGQQPVAQVMCLRFYPPKIFVRKLILWIFVDYHKSKLVENFQVYTYRISSGHYNFRQQMGWGEFFFLAVVGKIYI